MGLVGRPARVDRALRRGSRLVGSPVRQVVRGRQAERLGQLPRPPRRRRQGRPRRLPMGGRERRPPRGHLRRAARHDPALCQRAEEPRRRQGRRRRDLPADVARDAGRDARVRAHRRRAQRRLRRLLGDVGRRANGGLGREGPGHRRRDDAPRRADPDEGRARRGSRRRPGPRARDRRQPRRHRPPDDRGPRRQLGAGRRRRRPDLRARADGLRGPALHPLHVGFDRQAEGHTAHHRRLPDPGGGYPQARLRPARRRRLLVRGRRRLGHGPQLHRLRAAWSTARPR